MLQLDPEILDFPARKPARDEHSTICCLNTISDKNFMSLCHLCPMSWSSKSIRPRKDPRLNVVLDFGTKIQIIKKASSGAVFETLNFLRNLRTGPIS